MIPRTGCDYSMGSARGVDVVESTSMFTACNKANTTVEVRGVIEVSSGTTNAWEEAAEILRPRFAEGVAILGKLSN